MAVPVLTPGVLLVSGAVLAVSLSAALGANDVANSLGTAVGTKAISLEQALVIGAIMEFSGAVLFGSTVTRTISSGVVAIPRAALSGGSPAPFMLGMASVLLGTTFWMAAATRLGLPVSSTHSVIGALVGLGLISGWGINMLSLRRIALSWVISPVIGGIVTVLLYSMVRRTIVEAKYPARATRRLLPIVSGFMMFVLSLFVIGNLNMSSGQISRETSLLVAAAVAMAGAGFSRAAAAGIRSRATLARRLEREQSMSIEERQQAEVQGIFRMLQVVTACLLSFSHGSNDVSNAIGPFSAMFAAYAGKTVITATPVWVLLLGGVGISFGLWFWGRPVMETVGTKITPLVPTKGFCAELATATTVLVASELGLPVSTTHTLIGCIVALGVLSDERDAVDLRVLRNIAMSWGITLPVSALGTVVTYSLTRRFLP